MEAGQHLALYGGRLGDGFILMKYHMVLELEKFPPASTVAVKINTFTGDAISTLGLSVLGTLSTLLRDTFLLWMQSVHMTYPCQEAPIKA